MNHTFLALTLSALALTGCGGKPAAAPQAAAATTFADPKLQTLWEGAQAAVATQPITLNAAIVAETGAAPDTIAPDVRAFGINPNGVTVTTVPDLTVAELQSENPGVTLQHQTDPTGVIHAPEGASARYCHSYTQGNAVYVAASLEYSDGATGYEFSNIILARLGYNTSGR